MHQPGDQVSAIAAEIVESSIAVLFRILEPLQKFRLHSYLFGSLVTIVDHDPAQIPQAALRYLVVGGPVAGIPGGLVVHEHLNVVLPGRTANRQCIFQRHGQGLFHHDAEPVLRGCFDHLPVLADRSVNQQSLGMAGRNHRIQLRVEQAGIEMKLLCVAVGKRLVGIHDAVQRHQGFADAGHHAGAR